MLRMENILVSIIIPVYNVECYLKDCIESVLAQTYFNLEVILIDDGSTDNSGRICDEYAKRDQRVQVIHQKNRGVSYARNAALEVIKGEYILFVDSDDIVSEYLVEICLKNIIETDSDIVIYPYRKFDTEFPNIFPINEIKRIYMDRDELFAEIFRGSEGKQRFRMLACNKMYKAELFRDVRFPVGRKYGEDAIVTYNIIKKVKQSVFLENTILYYYRDNPNSALNKKINQDNLQLFLTYNEMYLDISTQMPQYKKLIVYAYVMRLFDCMIRVRDEIRTKKEQLTFLRNLKKIINLEFIDVIKVSYITLKLKILLLFFFCNIRLFLRVYMK